MKNYQAKLVIGLCTFIFSSQSQAMFHTLKKTQLSSATVAVKPFGLRLARPLLRANFKASKNLSTRSNAVNKFLALKRTQVKPLTSSEDTQTRYARFRDMLLWGISGNIHDSDSASKIKTANPQKIKYPKLFKAIPLLEQWEYSNEELAGKVLYKCAGLNIKEARTLSKEYERYIKDNNKVRVDDYKEEIAQILKRKELQIKYPKLFDAFPFIGMKTIPPRNGEVECGIYTEEELAFKIRQKCNKLKNKDAKVLFNEYKKYIKEIKMAAQKNTSSILK